MSTDWQELTSLTRGEQLVVERVRIASKDIVVEGEFELPPLARLAAEDQVFVMAFVRAHGSIKEMERLFGISYPTVKKRLDRLAQQFEFVDLDAAPSRGEVLGRVEAGDLSVAEALEVLAQ